MPSHPHSSLLDPEATESYRRFETAYAQLRSAHNHLRANLSRLALADSEARDAADQALQHLVTRVERACFEYRLAAREFVETAAPNVESSRALSEQGESSGNVAENPRKEVNTSLPTIAPAPNREAAASHPVATVKAGASAPPAGPAVPNTASS